MNGVISSKHSSIASNPELAPKSENHGVQMCEGMTVQRGQVSAIIFRNSLTSIPRMGRPSDRRFPTPASLVLIFSTDSKSGARTRRWTFRTFPILE